MSKKRRYHGALQSLVERARRNEAGSPPRKHHIVPASYLQRWADDSQIRVTVVDESRSYTCSPQKAARETDFYRMEHPELDPEKVPPLVFETMLSEIEGTAKTVIDELLDHFDPAQVAPEQLAYFAWHLAITMHRGKAFRVRSKEMLASAERLRLERISDDGIRQQLKRHGIEPTPGEVAKHRAFLDDLQAERLWIAEPKAATIGRAAETAEAVGAYFLTREWQIYKTPPILVTCDEPVVILGGPGWPRSEESGLVDAGVVLYPLAPTALLVMFHTEMRPRPPKILSRAETAEINREIIANAATWAFERPSRRVAQGLRVPPAPPKPFLREGPLPQVDGVEGELYRFFTPTRWAEGSSAPPWPVARWWWGWKARRYPRMQELQSGEKVAIDPEARPRSSKRKPRRSRK